LPASRVGRRGAPQTRSLVAVAPRDDNGARDDTVIGNRHDQVDSIYERVIAILDRETAYGRAPVPGAVETEPEAHPSAGRREYRDTIVVPTIWREGT